jgi:hypothetical protein
MTHVADDIRALFLDEDNPETLAADFLRFANAHDVFLTAYQRLAINKIMKRPYTYGLFFGPTRMDAINLLLKYVDERAKR